MQKHLTYIKYINLNYININNQFYSVKKIKYLPKNDILILVCVPLLRSLWLLVGIIFTFSIHLYKLYLLLYVCPVKEQINSPMNSLK